MASHRLVTMLVTGVGLLAGCSSPAYFDINSEIHQGGPSTVDETMFIGVAFLRSQDDDEVELVALDLVDPQIGQAEMRALVVDMRTVEGDAVGVVSMTTPLSARRAIAALEPLEGFSFEANESFHPISIVTAIRTPDPGTVTFSAIRLDFRVNGGPVRTQEIPSGVTLCVRERPSDEPCESAPSEQPG